MSKALATKKVAAALLGFGMVLAIAGTANAQTTSNSSTLATLQAQVQALLAQIAALQGTGTASSGSGACFTFSMDEWKGKSGGQVMWIQEFLNGHGYQIAASGAGSPGNETSYFGGATKAAVMKFQSSNGVSPASGYWGPLSRAKANSICAGSTSTGTGTGTGTTSGAGVTVTASTQPANSLAPQGAVRVPFTSFTLTNNSGAAVTINGITVQRTGLASDAAFANIVLIDSNGMQLGNTQTFNSNHTATVGGTITLNAGQSMTYTVAGNMAASEAAYAGQVASISVTGVNTSVPVSGMLPITGAQQTINATVSIGSVTTAISSLDPNNAANKPIGSTGIKFTAVRFTAGSAEDLKLFSIRWRINGSASVSDLSNLATVVNGTSYPAVVSSDGRYVTSTFPGGILVQKGNSIDVYIQGDLTGSNSAGRIAEFDIDKTSDVYFVGQTYGYGVAMSLGTGAVSTASTHATSYTSGQPVFQGSTVSIQAGTVTTIQNATSIASQSIPVNVPNTVLGGFQTNFSGEPVTVSGMVFTITTGATSTAKDVVTSVSIVDPNGAVVAGPVDAVSTGANTMTVTFSNSITFPVGAATYTLKGKVPSDYPTGATIQLSTTPSSWTSPTGQTTGNTITISTANFTMNTMTVRAASLTESAASTPASQSVVAGGQNIMFSNIQLDASQSGEDIKLSNLQVNESGTAQTSNLNTCQLMNGSTILNTGSNVLNTVVPGQNTITFDNSLTVPKGTVVTLGLECNISSSATSSSTFIFGVNSTGNTGTATGAVSSNSVSPTVNTTNSGTMTVNTGALTVSVDASSPSYTVAAGGTTGVIVGVYKLHPTGESLTLTKLGMTLTGGHAADLGTVYLYQGSTLVGTAVFTGTSQTATSTLSAPVTLTKDTDNLITVKADLADVGTSQPGTEGDLVQVDPLNYQATGQSSGLTINGGATAGVAGLRVFNTYPTVTLDTGLPTSGVSDGRLIHFKVTANSAGNVGIGQLTFKVSTTSATVTNVQLFAFTDPNYQTPISGQGSGGQIGATLATIANNANFTIAPSTSAVEVPAGQTYYFELRGVVAGSGTTYSVLSTLVGDASGQGATAFSSVSPNGFVWSANATGTAATSTGSDWTNSYSLFSSSGLFQNRTQ